MLGGLSRRRLRFAGCERPPPATGSRMLDRLPDRDASAAANMATDFLLLQHYPRASHARLRFYGWQRPAATFGYSQPIAWVREQLAGDPPLELIRRPTGGGIVDHRDDWTYALVLPRGHPLADARAADSYAAVHRVLAEVLTGQGVPARLADACPPADAGPGRGPGVCFARAECADVVRADTGAKIAGAAQKRSKHGLLLQGSLWRPHVGPVDRLTWQDAFATRLAALLDREIRDTAFPAEWDEAVNALAENYAAPEWNERR